MLRKILWTLLLVGTGVAGAVQITSGQGRGGANPEMIAQRTATEKELESVAVIERKLMVPMRDGKRMATDVYRPKDMSKKYAIIAARLVASDVAWPRHPSPSRNAAGRAPPRSKTARSATEALSPSPISAAIPRSADAMWSLSACRRAL